MFAGAATKGKTKDKVSESAPSYVPVRQEIIPDCGSEEDECANMASVKKAPSPRIDDRAMYARSCDVTVIEFYFS
jgi:hypothetical protein